MVRLKAETDLSRITACLIAVLSCAAVWIYTELDQAARVEAATENRINRTMIRLEIRRAFAVDASGIETLQRQHRIQRAMRSTAQAKARAFQMAQAYILIAIAIAAAALAAELWFLLIPSLAMAGMSFFQFAPVSHWLGRTLQ